MATKRKRFSLLEKTDIIKKAKEYNGSKADFAKSIDIPYSTLQTILKQADSVEENLEKMGKLAKKRKTVKSSPFEELENFLFQWFNEVRATHIPVNGPILKEKAKEIASKLGIQGFTASNGWIDRFKKRHNLSYKSICGESAAVDCSTVQEWVDQILPSLVQKYSPKDIFNADETGLFYNLLPDRTFAVKGENCHGGKLSKLRLTVLLCTNSDGSEKLTPLVIGKSKKKPRCFKNVKSFPTEYDSNPKAWMTRKIFENFLRKLDRQMRLQKRSILLFIDQCTAHIVELKLKNVRIELLPANCTSKIQPCDLGIIRSFKVNYRTQLVKKSLLSIQSGGKKKSINVLEALHMVSSAWERVGEKCISSCFVKGGFPKVNRKPVVKGDKLEREESENEDSDETEAYFDTSETHLICKESENEDSNGIQEYFHTSDTIDFAKYVACDENVVTSEIPTLNDLIGSESDSSDNDEDDDDGHGIPSATEAIQALKIVKAFLSNREGQEKSLQKLICVENVICDVADKNKIQSKITDFFNA